MSNSFESLQFHVKREQSTSRAESTRNVFPSTVLSRFCQNSLSMSVSTKLVYSLKETPSTAIAQYIKMFSHHEKGEFQEKYILYKFAQITYLGGGLAPSSQALGYLMIPSGQNS